MRILSIATLILLVISLFIAYGCRKDNPVPLPTFAECPCCRVQANAPQSIVAGDTTQMRVYPINLYLNLSGYGYDSLRLDVNDNGLNDFKIISYKYTSFGGGIYHCKAWIDNLNDSCLIGGIIQGDSLFSYQNVTYESNNPVIVTHTNVVTCEGNICCNSINSISNKIIFYQPGEVITHNQDWLLGGYIYKSGYTLNYGDYQVINDTLTNYEYVSNPTCNNITSSPLPKYVSIKKTICGIEKLGWIKFSAGPWGKLLLEEVAFQK